MQLSITAHEGPVTHVACVGDVSQLRFPANINNPLEDLLGMDCYKRQVLLDLGQAGFIDSSGVGWLMGCHRRFLAGGGRFIVHSVPPLVAQVIHLLKLETILTIKPDRATARALIGPAKGAAS
jgi:anti-anti-sigma factor